MQPATDTSTAAPPSGKRLVLAMHLGMWVFFFALHQLAFYRVMSLPDSLLRSTANILLLGTLFYGNTALYQQFFERKQWGRYAGAVAALFAVVLLARIVINESFSYDVSGTPYLQTGRLPFMVGAALTNVGILYLSLLYEMLKSRRRYEQRQLRLLNEQQHARLQFLRTQMNPHFLFNTLNNIYSLAVVQSEKTAPLVLRLSDLLQYVIYETQAATVPLEKEVGMLREYIDLFQLQFEHPRDIRFQVETGTDKTIEVEPLLLVPIVENCFKHCDFAENPEAFIDLALTLRTGELFFRAENTFNPGNLSKDKTGGVGLENIRRRLQLRYPGRHRLTIESNDRRFIIELSLQPVAASPLTQTA